MITQLVPWRRQFINELVSYANNKHISDNLADGFPHPYTEQDGISFIDRVSREEPVKVFAIQYSGETVGSIGIFPDSDIHRKNAAIAYWVAEPYWGKGIAAAAIQQIVKYGFDNFDITRIYAKPFGFNVASQRVLGKCGFMLEAKLERTIYKNGVFLDEMIFGLRKNA